MQVLKRLIGVLLGATIIIGLSDVFIVMAGGGFAFISRPVGVAYLILWSLWLLITALGRPPGRPSSLDRQMRILVPLSVVIAPVMVAGPPWEYAHFDGPLPRDGLLAWLGAILFAGSLVLEGAALWELHGLYTAWLGIQPEHRLVTSGPYRLVRHPGYLSNILSMVGIGLALSSLIALTLAAMLVPFLLSRMKTEEQMLIGQFGEEYRAYLRRTRRLVPFVY